MKEGALHELPGGWAWTLKNMEQLKMVIICKTLMCDDMVDILAQ